MLKKWYVHIILHDLYVFKFKKPPQDFVWQRSFFFKTRMVTLQMDALWSLCTSSAGFLFRIDKSWCVWVHQQNGGGVPWGSFWGRQKPSISLFQQGPMMRSADGQRFYCWWHNGKSWYKAQRGRKGTHPEFPTPHPPGQSKILLDIFRWMQKKRKQKPLTWESHLPIFFSKWLGDKSSFFSFFFLSFSFSFAQANRRPNCPWFFTTTCAKVNPVRWTVEKRKKKWFLVARNLGLSLF